MRGFPSELEVPARLEVELRTRRLQLANTRRTFLDEHLDCFGVTQRRTCGERVLPVQLRRISGAERCRDSALCVGGGAVEQRALGEHHHIAVRRMRATRCEDPQLRFPPRESAFEFARPCVKSTGETTAIERGASRLAGSGCCGRFFSSDEKTDPRRLASARRAHCSAFTGRERHCESERRRRRRIGIVLDVGGRGDKSFNDGAYAGADSATKTLGTNIRFIEPGEGADREAGLRLLAAEGMDLVIGVGFIFTDDLSNLAKEYPNGSVRGNRLRARNRQGWKRHSAAAQHRGAQVPRGRRIVSSSAHSLRSSANRRRWDSSAEWTFR